MYINVHLLTWIYIKITIEPFSIKAKLFNLFYIKFIPYNISVLENEPKDTESQISNDDPVTRAIGAIGKWQIWVCFVVFLVKFPVAWHQMSIIFLAPPVNFTCAANHSEIFANHCHANCSSYAYDRSVFKETIISQWDLVCTKEWLKNLTQTIFMLGILVGNMVFGYLSDR